MRKIIYIIGVIGVIFFMNACANTKEEDFRASSVEQTKIGLVETTAMNYSSTIHWYDKELNKISEKNMKYAMLGSSFHNPVYHDNEVYMIPQGLGNRKDTKKVISIDKKNLKIKEFSLKNIALNDVAVSNDYIYTINTLNGNTHICRLNKNNKALNEIILKDEYVSGITAVKGKIYAFSADMVAESAKFYLYIYNEELELLYKEDITQYGTSQYKFMNDENYLYTGVILTKEDRPASIILKISIDTNEIEAIDIGEDFPNDILQYKDKIIITNHDLVTYEGAKITILDKNTKKVETVDLNTKTEHSGIIENMLVIANQEKISLYDIENNFKLINEVKVDKGKDSYISNIIIIK